MIGIVGGMGPHAGLDLVRKILDNTNASSDQEHLPISMLSLSNTIPDRSRFINREEGATNPGSAIAAVVQKMVDQGCETVGIACNTAHAGPIFNEVIAHLIPTSQQKLLHMIEEVSGYVARHFPAVRRVGILATTATVNSKLYDEYLRNHSIETIYLSKSDQHQISEVAIRDEKIGIKAKSNPVTPEARKIVADSILALRDAGADAVFLACTELPLAVDFNIEQPLLVIDPTDVFARVIIETYAPAKLKEL